MAMHGAIFDFGGVLTQEVDQSGRRKWESRLCLEEGGLTRAIAGSALAQRALLGELTEDQLWRELAKQFELSRTEIHEFQHDYWSGVCLNVELVRFLASLHQKYKLAILSNAWSGARRVIMHGYNLRNLVDSIVISAEVGLAKPDTAIYNLAAEKLGVSPDETVFVDDAIVNVDGARAIGMVGIEFRDTKNTIAEIAALLV